MKRTSLTTILGEIDTLRTNFTNCRAHFPHVNKTAIGAQSIHTAPYYVRRGFDIVFGFSQPLTQEHIEKINEIGSWITQNVLIRLYALLESYHFISETINIDQSIDGWKELDLLRRLRNVFAHTSGKYNSNNTEQKELVEEMVRHFNLSISDPQYIPIAIDTVIDPIFRGCRRYVRGKYAKNTNK